MSEKLGVAACEEATQPPAKKQKTTRIPKDGEDGFRRRYMLTNWDLSQVPTPHERISYCCYSYEIAPTTGRRHIQLYVECAARTRLKTLRSHVPWLEKCGADENYGECKGTPYECVLYVQKMRDEDVYRREINAPDAVPPSEGFTEFGVRSAITQGARTDIQKTVEELAMGVTTMDQLVMTKPAIFNQFRRTFEYVDDLKIMKKERTWRTLGIWLHGKTGAGKSYLARRLSRELGSVYNLSGDARAKGWFDSYVGQEVILIDEMASRDVPYTTLLAIIDENFYEFPRRGRRPVPCLAKYVVITANLKPEEMYFYGGRDCASQLLRRVDVHEVTEATRDALYAELLEKYKK